GGDAGRLLRSLGVAAADGSCLLTPPRAAATAAHGTGAPRAATRHGPSSPPPWPAYRAATAWLSRSRGWTRAVAGAGVRSRGANRNYSSNGRPPPAAAPRLRPCTAC